MKKGLGKTPLKRPERVVPVVSNFHSWGTRVGRVVMGLWAIPGSRVPCGVRACVGTGPLRLQCVRETFRDHDGTDVVLGEVDTRRPSGGYHDTRTNPPLQVGTGSPSLAKSFVPLLPETRWKERGRGKVGGARSEGWVCRGRVRAPPRPPDVQSHVWSCAG